MPTPVWLGGSAGYGAQSGQVNQFITTHNSIWAYSGSLLEDNETTGSAVYTSTEAQYLAQSFTTGPTQTEIGPVLLQISTVGGSPITATITPLVVSIHASFGGIPTGSAISSAILTEQAVYSSPFWVSMPLLSVVTPSTVYQLVVAAAGSSSAYYAWQQSDQPSGAATSPDDSTWTQQAYGFMYQIYDNSGSEGPVTTMVDDDGARTAQMTYTGGLLTSLREFSQTQDGSDLLQTRTFTYSGNNVIGLS
jgi:hypothetical protein